MARELNIKVTVETAQAKQSMADLDKKFAEAEKSVGKFEDSVKKSDAATTKLGGTASILGGVFAGIQISQMVDRLVDFGQQIIADADALMTLHDASDLSLKALQQIRIVTDDAGGSLESMAKAAEYLQRMVGGGSNSTVDALQRLGFSLQEVRDMSTDEQFFAITKAMQGVTDQEELMAIGTKLMGRGFAEALPAIKQGFDEARKSASLMSDETVIALANLADKFSAAGRYIKYLGGEILADFLTFSTSVQRANADAVAKHMEEVVHSFQKALPKIDTGAIIPPGLPADLDAVTRSLDAMNQQHLATSKAAEAATKAHDAYQRKLDAVNQKILEATRDTGNLTDAQEDASVMYRRLGLSVEDISVKLNVSAIAIKRFLEAHDVLEERIEHLTEHVDAKAIPAFTGLIMTWAQMTNTGKGLTYDGLLPMAKGFDDVARAERAADEWAKQLARSQDALQGQLAQTIGLMPDISGVAREHMSAATEKTEEWKMSLESTAKMFAQLGAISGGIMGGILKDIGQVVVVANQLNKDGGMLHSLLGIGPGGAQTNGQKLANVGYAGAGEIASSIGNGMTDGEGNQRKSGQVLAMAGQGAKVGTMIMPGWGTAIGAGVGAIAGAVKVDPAELAARDKFTAWQKDVIKNFDLTATAAQKSEAAANKVTGNNEQWAKTIITVRDAYVAVGKTGDQALKDINTATDATHHTTDEVNAALRTMNDILGEQKQDAADLDAAIQKYGFSIAELGPTMRKQELTAQAVQLENDFRLLAGSGIDVNTVLEHMGGSINDFLHLAQQTGSEVPTEMQPILQKMIDLGQLTDANGVAITDMSQIGVTFSETMTQGFDRVVLKLQQLIEQIGLVPAALNQIPKQVDVTVQGHYVAPDMPSFDGEMQSFHTGGAILPFVARAHKGLAVDEVPIIAQTGEGILNRGAMRRLGGASGLNRLNAGGGGGGITINVGEGAVKVTQDMSESEARELVGGTFVREMRRKGVRFAA